MSVNMKKHTSLSALFFGVFLTMSLVAKPGSSAQQCATMIGTPLEACKIAGYNSTFPLPYKMSNKTQGWARWFLNYMLDLTQSNNCTSGLQQMGEMIVCAIYVPKCDRGKLMLPCKRVCVEFMNRCTDKIDPFWFDYFIAFCTLLPDYKGSSGKCIEPPNFEKLYNVTDTGVLQGNCHKLIFPWCQGLNYQYTIMKESTQIRYYKYLYGRNFTNDSSVDKVISSTSNLDFWRRLQKNYSDCAMSIQKTLCADLFSPCFPHEGTSLYSVCYDTCLDMRKRCPNIAKEPAFLGNFFDSCESWASGKSDHGYCKHTTWPKPLQWLNHFKEKRPFPTIPPRKKTPSSSLPPYVIEVVVIVPLVSLLIIGVVLLWRQRKQPWFVRMFKRDDDTKDIMQEEPEMGTINAVQPESELQAKDVVQKKSQKQTKDVVLEGGTELNPKEIVQETSDENK